MKINIAIDGPSASGKSSISQIIAEKLNYFFINSGSIYRAISYYFWKNQIQVTSEKIIDENLKNIKISFDTNNKVYLNNQEVSSKIRTEEISNLVSHIAEFAKVREMVVKIIQEFTQKNKGIVMDGRDVGSVIMPDAELKIFLTASAQIRAERRFKQNQELHIESNFEEVLHNIIKRDENDSTRKLAPLQKNSDAIEIDSSNLKIDEVVDQIIKLAKEKEGKRC